MYWAKAIRMAYGKSAAGTQFGQLFWRDERGVGIGVVRITETNHPEVREGWTMQEDVARDKYNITELEIDESRALASYMEPPQIVNI